MTSFPARNRAPAGLAIVEEGTVRIAPLLGAVPLLSEMGVDPYRVMAEAGLDRALFDDPENIVPFADAGRFLAGCAASTGCEHLGILLGENLGLDVLGVVGRLAQHAADVGSALRNVILHLHLHDQGAVPALWVSGDRAMVGYTIYQPDVHGTEQIYDLAVAITRNVVKALAGSGAEPSEVRLHRARPKDIDPYRRFFRTRVHFGEEYPGVLFPASWLERPLRGADALVHQEIMREIEALEARGAGDLAAQLKRVLRRMLIGGACQGETCRDRVADLFAIHRRTLNRRLSDQGTSFKALVDEARYEIARQLLRDTRLPVGQVAAALDYSDAASLDRAFRRWSGTTPSAWREANTAT
jgi:AraC-like DNA-binding protein